MFSKTFARAVKIAVKIYLKHNSPKLEIYLLLRPKLDLLSFKTTPKD